MASPKIKQDEDLVALLKYLDEKIVRPAIYGPVIFYRPASDGVLAHERYDVLPVGTWEGGMKIRLCEGVDRPPVPGVEFLKPIQFIDEGNDYGKEEI